MLGGPELSVLLGPIAGCPGWKRGLVFPARTAVTPRVQIHDQVGWFRVSVLHFALVAVRIYRHLVVRETRIRRLRASLRAYRHLQRLFLLLLLLLLAQARRRRWRRAVLIVAQRNALLHV